MKKKCVIFDLDLTLVDLKLGESSKEKSVRKKVATLYIENGIPISSVISFMAPISLYVGAYDVVRKKLPEKKFSEIQKKASKIIEEEYENPNVEKAECMKGSREILRWLKDNGFKIGVVSLNAEEVVSKVLEKFDLMKYVDELFGRNSDGRPKPHPDQIENCLKSMKCDSDSALMVGDNPQDFRASSKIGLYSIAVNGRRYTKMELNHSGADRVISKLKELKSTISITLYEL